MEDKDFYWIVGLLEGEGTFLKSPPSEKNKITIQLQMTDEDIVKRAADLFEVTYCKCNPKKSHHKSTFKFSVCGSRAAFWMDKMKPFMGKRRQQQIEQVLASYTPPKQNSQLPSSDKLKDLHRTLSLRQIAKIYKCSHQRILNALKK